MQPVAIANIILSLDNDIGQICVDGLCVRNYESKEELITKIMREYEQVTSQLGTHGDYLLRVINFNLFLSISSL